MKWDPEQYLKFAEFRRRGGHDLIARIPLASYHTIYDLGCGAGELTRLLQSYWPNAKVVGIDSSESMLAEANKKPSGIFWETAQIEQWQPTGAADLIFSNAALQWLDDHPALLKRLISFLSCEATLAIQMPYTVNQPSHQQLILAAQAGPWRKTLEPILRLTPVAAPKKYYELLAPLVQSVDIWETTYYHPLTGKNPIVEWMKGVSLKKLLDALEEPHRSEFLAEYSARMNAAYTQRPDGVTIFPFNRLFIIARV